MNPLILAVALCAPAPAQHSLAERLGYRATDRLLIINGDDVGNSHAANAATIDAMEHGLLTSGTIMVPCPWFPEIATYCREHPKADFGLHLTHTSEWHTVRWRPICDSKDVPGLVDPDGYLWPNEADVYKHAKPDEGYREAKAQIEKALKAGIDVTHLDSHMGAMQYDPRFHIMYARLAKEYQLPVRMGSLSTYEKAGFPQIRQRVADMGIVFPDNLIHEEKPARGESRKHFWMGILKALKPGVTELYIHAAVDGDELRAFTGSWKARSEDYRLFTTDPDIRRAIEQGHIIRIGYRALRDLMRKTQSAALMPLTNGGAHRQQNPVKDVPRVRGISGNIH